MTHDPTNYLSTAPGTVNSFVFLTQFTVGGLAWLIRDGGPSQSHLSEEQFDPKGSPHRMTMFD